MPSTQTLESVRSWKRDLDAKLSSQEWGYLPAVLLANKSDLPAHSKIQEEDLDRLAQEENFAAWFLTSAKDDLNISEATDFLADRMINRSGASFLFPKTLDSPNLEPKILKS